MPFTGDKIIYYSSCESTNTMAINLLATQNVLEGTIVITDEQTQGKGQRGKQWVTLPGQNLTFSIIFYPSWLAIENTFSLYIISALGICEALFPTLQYGLTIKWPNDIYAGDKKLGGILVENMVQKDTIKAAVIGIGLNVNQTNFNDLPYATSLALLASREFSLAPLLRQLTDGIQKQYDRLYDNRLNELKQDYVKHLYGLHTTRTFQDQQGIFQGVIQGIDDRGRLVIDALEHGMKYYMHTEVTYIT